jgi:lysophospholipase L1-like esterase
VPGGSSAGGVTTGGVGGGSGGTVAACASDESSKCTSGTGPLGTEIKCDFGGSDGNYDVTVEVGGADSGDTYVDAEMYRRMLPQLATLAGQPRRLAFTVNVRTPEGQPIQVGDTDSVPGLQVYFRGPKPKVTAVCHAAASKPLMLWLGGDSTVCDQDSTNYTGWGQRLPQFLQAGVSVANYADSGESSSSFLGSSKMFGAIKSRWKAGDWFFVQLGHNDKTVSAQTFQSNMKSFVTQAKAASVNIVLITPIARVGYALPEEHVNSPGANLPQIIRDLGKSENVPVIDLTVTTWNWIQTITPKDFFASDSSASGGYDHTHLGPKGADAVAGFVRDAIKSNPGVPALVPYLR